MAALSLAMAVLALLASGQTLYRLPPKDVVAVVEAPPPPRPIMSPRGDLMVLAEYQAMPAIADLAQPLHRLGGIRVTPQTNSRQQMVFITSLTLVTVADGKSRKVALPEGIKIGGIQWSYDGRRLAFSRLRENGLELWVADAVTGEAKALTGPVLSAVLGPVFRWLPGSGRILAFTVPETRGDAPTPPPVPTGPNIEETAGKVSKVATYQDLLKTAFDDTLFEYYAASQVVEIDALTGAARKIGRPDVYLSVSASPDSTYLLVHRIKKPYSHSVPYFRFAHSLEIWDKEGTPVKTLADLPAAEEVPMNGVPIGLRSPEWAPLDPASLIWAEALDGGDPEKQVPHRDKLMKLAAPFLSEPQEIWKVQHRYQVTDWLGAPGKSLVWEYDWKRRWQTAYLLDFAKPEVAPRKIFDLSTQDDYGDPGSLVMTTSAAGDQVAVQDKEWVYLSGRGASPQGDRPFLDRMSLQSGKKERLFACTEGRFEAFVAFAGASRSRLVISSESPAEPPNYYLTDLKSKKKTALTAILDPAPQLTGMKKEIIKYKRADGVELSATLYLPPGYQTGERLPVVVWAYPLEYSDARTAGQVRGSPFRFTYFRGPSQLFFVTQGYAVLDGAQMPVLGDPKTMNDTFVEQIVSNAKAAIDALDKMGVGDPGASASAATATAPS
jgi:dipeptidyl aminopeptidase/acylaminoacyl peptidase